MNYHDDAVAGKKALTLLIIINAAIFLFFAFQPENPFYIKMALFSGDIKNLKLWELVTYMFVHAGFFHVFFNMYSLYIFGMPVAEELGRTRFLLLYFISGIVGGGLWVWSNWGSPIPVVGASGAVFGVMMAMAMLYPNREYMLLFFPVPVKCKTLILVFAAIEIMSEYGKMGQVAHLAHLGGFVAAYFFVRLFCSKLVAWDPLDMIFSPATPRKSAPPPSGWQVHNPPPPSPSRNTASYDPKNIDPRAYRKDDPIPRQEIDRLLDKIASQGINSLTPEETVVLKKAREQLKRQ